MSAIWPVIGIDIGGAHIKFAVIGDNGSLQVSRSLTFPMWTDADRLAAFLESELRSLGKAGALAITMTGEMADGFIDRAEGVRHITASSWQAARTVGIDSVGFYGVDGQFRDHDQAAQAVDLIAGANWHATAAWVSQTMCDGDGILIDIGSTTTDIIPLRDGVVATGAKTDHDRLIEGSLVYIGCGRTPVSSLVDELDHRGRRCPVMNETFATMDDVMILMGMTAEDSSDLASADGKPRTRPMAANRMARMIGLDRRSVGEDAAVAMAKQILQSAQRVIVQRFDVLDPGGTIILGGHGSGIFLPPAQRSLIRLADRFGADASRCFPAMAVARLFSHHGPKG